MCKKSLIASIGLPLLGAVSGDLLGPELGLSPGIGGGIGGALGGLGAGFLNDSDPLGIGINAALGGLGGFGLGSVLGPGAGFGEGGVFAGPGVAGAAAHGAGGVPAGTTAASVAAPTVAASADAAGGEGGILDFIKNNQEWLLPVIGVGGAALMGDQDMPGEKQLKQLAAQAAETSKLQQALLTGQLPPGAEGAVHNALNDAIAGIHSNYASMGLSGSTMEAQDIAAAQSRAVAARFDLAQKIATTGLQAAQLGGNLYSTIANYYLRQDDEFADLLAGLSGGGGYSGGLASAA